MHFQTNKITTFDHVISDKRTTKNYNLLDKITKTEYYNIVLNKLNKEFMHNKNQLNLQKSYWIYTLTSLCMHYQKKTNNIIIFNLISITRTIIHK